MHVDAYASPRRQVKLHGIASSSGSGPRSFFGRRPVGPVVLATSQGASFSALRLTEIRADM